MLTWDEVEKGLRAYAREFLLSITLIRKDTEVRVEVTDPIGGRNGAATRTTYRIGRTSADVIDFISLATKTHTPKGCDWDLGSVLLQVIEKYGDIPDWRQIDRVGSSNLWGLEIK